MPGGAPIPAPTASMVSGYRDTSATRGKKLSVTSRASRSAADQSRVSISRRGTVAQLWKVSVRPGTTRTISVTVPEPFPKGAATVSPLTPKATGKASNTVSVKYRGDHRNRTGSCRFCRPMRSHFARSPWSPQGRAPHGRSP